MKALIVALLVFTVFVAFSSSSKRVTVIHDSYLIDGSVDLLATERITESGWPLRWLRETDRPIAQASVDGNCLILNIVLGVIVWATAVNSWRKWST